MDSAELIKLQVAIEQLAIAQEGDLEMATAFTGVSIAGSTNSIQFATFSPPVDQQDVEFIPVVIAIFDAAGIDTADRIQIDYQDVLANIQIPFYNMTGHTASNVAPYGDSWIWPTQQEFTATNNINILLPYTPLRLFRRVNGEAWRRLLFDASTSATVGTRLFRCIIVYRRRPTTRI